MISVSPRASVAANSAVSVAPIEGDDKTMRPPRQAAAGRLGVDVAAFDLDRGAERLEHFDMQIDRPRADGAAARHGDARRPKRRQQRAEHQDACAHPPHNVIRCLRVAGAGCIERQRPAGLRVATTPNSCIRASMVSTSLKKGVHKMFNVAALPGPSVDAGLSRYLIEIRKFPLLRPEQELAYAKRWREHQDREAAYQLVTSHLRLVAKIAMRYRGYGLPIAEIVSEGNIGLMQAVKSLIRTGVCGLPPTRLVDQGHYPGVHPAIMVARQDRSQRQPEEAVLQTAKGQRCDLGASRRRFAAGPGQTECEASRGG